MRRSIIIAAAIVLAGCGAPLSRTVEPIGTAPATTTTSTTTTSTTTTTIQRTTTTVDESSDFELSALEFAAVVSTLPEFATISRGEAEQIGVLLCTVAAEADTPDAFVMQLMATADRLAIDRIAVAQIAGSLSAVMCYDVAERLGLIG